MRVLFLTLRLPGQLMRGDQLRASQHIRLLSQRHRITLLVFDSATPDAAALADMQACCEQVIVIRRSVPGMAARLLGALFSSRPLQVSMFDSAALRAAITRLCAASNFDLAHVQLARLGPMLEPLAGLPCVLDFVDALSLNMRRRAALDRGPLRFVVAAEAVRLARYERALCAQASAVVVCSAQDRAAIGSFPNLHLVRNGVDLARFPWRAPGDRGDGIVFIGNLGYFPNIDAATWFADEVMPLLCARRATVHLQLVGARPAPALRRRVAQWPNVELIGEVPDVHPWLARAAVAVVPLRSGSGQQLKMLEAMSAGTPVVATSLSAAGLDVVDGEHLLIADDSLSMAAAVMRLLTDPQLALRLATAARALVERAYSWQCSAAELEAQWLQAARSEATTAPAIRLR